MTAPQQPHPLRCETCANIECEYYSIRDNMSAGHDHQTGWRASPGVITFAVGCASHSSATAREQLAVSTNGILPEVRQVPDGSSRAPALGMCRGASTNYSEQPPAPTADALLDFVRLVETKNREMAALMRRNKIKISDLEDPMQKLAFTFYTEIGELAHKAGVLLAEHEAALLRGEQHG